VAAGIVVQIPGEVDPQVSVSAVVSVPAAVRVNAQVGSVVASSALFSVGAGTELSKLGLVSPITASASIVPVAAAYISTGYSPLLGIKSDPLIGVAV
jgi:hypothetical protein